MYGLIVAGLYMSVMNWVIVIRHYLYQKTSSMVIGVPGVLLAFGLSALPDREIAIYWWLAFFVDFSCIPYLLYLLFCHVLWKLNKRFLKK